MLIIAPSNLNLLCLYASAVAFAILVSWLFRRVSAQPSQPLNRLTRAYLIGGPNRAREVGFFQLVTEGWIKLIESGDFVPRVFSVDEDVTGILPLEREMLQWASQQVKFSSPAILRRTYRELKIIESELIRSQLVLSDAEFMTAKVISLIPIGILAIDGIIHVASNVMKHFHEPRWVILVVATMAAIFELVNGSKHSTQLGSVQRDLILRESRIRIRQSQQSTLNGNPSTYDLLWKMGDQVLLGGLRSLGGNVFTRSSRLQNLDKITRTGSGLIQVKTTTDISAQTATEESSMERFKEAAEKKSSQ